MPGMWASVPAMVRRRGQEPGEQRRSLKLIAVSIAFPHHRTAEDKLDTLNTTKMKRSLTETIKDADGLSWMVGGTDLSLNDDTQKKLDIAWQPQFYGFADVTSVEILSKVLRDTFTANQNSSKAGADQRM